MPYRAARLRLDVGQMAEVIGEAGGGGAIVPGPERRLGDGDDAGAGHVEVVVGRAADAVDVGVDVLHLRFQISDFRFRGRGRHVGEDHLNFRGPFGLVRAAAF